MNRSAQFHAGQGWHSLIAGDHAAAAEHFRRALTLEPENAETLTGLAQALRRLGQLRDAVLTCDSAIRVAPRYAPAWLERGFTLASGGSMALAHACYERVVALDPGNADAHAGLASLHARDGNSKAGRAHAAAALQAEPGNIIATGALATIELEAGNPTLARALAMQALAALDEPSQDRIMLNSRLGDACDKLGEAEAGYAAYAACKADFATLYMDRYPGPAPHRDFIEGVTRELAAHRYAPGVADAVPGTASRHVFLLGYPRSGTTMVENILASLVGVSALEERPTLIEADRDFLAETGGLKRFATLGEADLARYRAAYWTQVAQAGIAVAGTTFVDMDPLKATRLPLIARLFPTARVLIMRRDPRDVVWSCFKTNFAPTNAAMDFTTLEGAARHYAAMMELTELARERLQLAFHEVRYESLVRNFDTESKEMCAFAGLNWSEELRRFDRTALKRGVSTASAGQVRRGLYDGSGQWKPYTKYFEPVMPILAPWIEKYGYV